MSNSHKELETAVQTLEQILTHPLNEEVSVRPGDEAKVCVLEYVVHNPHDVVEELTAGVEACHDERHV